MADQRLLAQRTRRVFEISIGRSALRYEHVVDKASALAPPEQRITYYRHTRRASPVLIGAVAGGLLAVISLLIAVQRTEATSVVRSPVVSMPVPEPSAVPTGKSGGQRLVTTHGRHAAVPLAAGRQAARTPHPAGAADVGQSTAIPDDRIDSQVFATRDQAVRAAFASGAMQQWFDDAAQARGYVVIGARDGRMPHCRTASVLTRLPDGDKVDHVKRCDGGAEITMGD